MAIVLAIMSIVAVSATVLFSLYLGILKKARLEAQLRQRAEMALEYLVKESRLAGGVGAPPRASVVVENDCAARNGYPDCDNSDRVTVTQPLVGYSRCQVERDRGGGFVDVRSVRVRAGFPPECCLQGNPAFARQVALTKDDVVTPALLVIGSGPCNFRYLPLGGAAPSTSMTGATIVMSDIKTFYREPPPAPGKAGRLVMHMELNGDDSVVGERLYLANDVVDFQASKQGEMLGLSVVSGRPHPQGILEVATAFDTTRTLAERTISREATARIALRDSR